MKAVRRSRTSFYSMSVLNFLLKNLQGCCLLFNYQGSFSLLSSQRQLIYIITFTIACQQLFYFSFSLSASIISVVRNSLINIPCLFLIVNIIFIFYFIYTIYTILVITFRFTCSYLQFELHFPQINTQNCN